jgi:hypothetical protein
MVPESTSRPALCARALTPDRRTALAAAHRELASTLLRAAALADAVATELAAEVPHAPTEAEWQDLGRP